MNITKLTITPIHKGITPFVEKNPSCEIASILIKDRLTSGAKTDIPKILKKVPDFLKGLVNPNTKVARTFNHII